MGKADVQKYTFRTFVSNADVDENPTAGARSHDVLNGPCQVYSLSGKNTHATTVFYLKVYDNTAPSEGTTDPDYVFRLEANKAFGPYTFGAIAGQIKGHKFSNGLSYACVTTAGTGGTTGPGDNEVKAVFDVEKL